MIYNISIMNSTLVKWLYHFRTFKYCQGHCSNKVLPVATIDTNNIRFAHFYSTNCKSRVKNSSKIFKFVTGNSFFHKISIQNLMLHRSSTIYKGHHFYSTESSNSKFIVDYNNIFSDENRNRVQKSLLQPQKQIRVVPKVENPKKAGVLVPLCLVNQKPSILFMVRSKEITKHKGEVCFPGGMMDPTDEDITYTAIRETYEEIRLPKSCVNVWGQLTQVPSREGGVMVTPVLATCGEIDINDLVLNPHEADDIFTCYIEDLCHLKNVGSTQFRTGPGFTLPVFHTGTSYRVWGLTAIILHLTLTVLAPGLYKFKLRHRS